MHNTINIHISETNNGQGDSLQDNECVANTRATSVILNNTWTNMFTNKNTNN